MSRLLFYPLLALLLFGASAVNAGASKPLLIPGKQALFQRVLSIPGAALGGLGSLVGATPDVVSIFQFLVQIGLGLWANDLRRAALARRGYVERAVVCGHDQAEAEQRYFNTVAPDAT